MCFPLLALLSLLLSVTHLLPSPPGMVSAVDVDLLPPLPEDRSPVSLLCRTAVGGQGNVSALPRWSDLPIFSSRLRQYLFTKASEAQTYIPFHQVCCGSDDLWEEVEQDIESCSYYQCSGTVTWLCTC